MIRLPRLLPCAAAILLGGCSTVAVFDHVAASNPGPQPTRILVQTPFDELRDRELARGFTVKAQAIFASCGIAARITHPGDGAADPLVTAPARADFKPDAILTGQKTIRSTNITQHGMFIFTLHSVPEDRDLAKVTIHSFGAVSDEQVEEVGAKFARTVLRTLVNDGVLRTSPPVT